MSSPQITGEFRRHRLEPLDHLAADIRGALLCWQLSLSSPQGRQYSVKGCFAKCHCIRTLAYAVGGLKLRVIAPKTELLITDLR
jgi:hypothetical protein